MLSRENQTDENALDAFDNLSLDVLIVICEHLDPIGLLNLSLSNHELGFIVKLNCIWSVKFKQSYPNVSHQQNLSLTYSEENKRVVHHHIADQALFRLFSQVSTHLYENLNEEEKKCFIFARANDLDSIKKNKITFTYALLNKKDKDRNSLIDLIVKNKNISLNQYVFACLCDENINVHDLLRYGVMLDQATDHFLALLVENQAFNMVVADEPLLFTAAKHNSIQSALLLLSYGANVDEPSKRKLRPLYIAAQCGHLGMVKLLVANQAKVNKIINNANTALMTAAQHGKYEVVKFLHECGADIHISCNSGVTALYLAMQGGHANIVTYLLEHGDYQFVNYHDKLPPLYVGVRYGHFEAVNVLLEYLIKNQIQVDTFGMQGINSIYACAEHNHPEICQLLLENGMSVEGSDLLTHDSPLNCASNHGNHQVVEVLCLHKPNFNRMLPDGGTALYNAVKKNHLSVVRLLCKQDSTTIDIDSMCINDYTPLCRAALTGYTDIAEVLINSGANVHHRTNNQSTPLYLAALGAHAGIVDLLVSKGADVNATCENGLTPLHAICKSRHPTEKKLIIIQALVKAGACPLSYYYLQFTPSQLANESSVVKIMENLEKMAALNRNQYIRHNSHSSLTPMLEKLSKDAFVFDVQMQTCQIKSFQYLFDNVTNYFGKAVLMFAYLNMEVKNQLTRSLVQALGFDYTFKAKKALQTMLRGCLGDNDQLYDELVKSVINPMIMKIEFNVLESNSPISHLFAAEMICLNHFEYHLSQSMSAMKRDSMASEQLSNTQPELLQPSWVSKDR